jgi:ring-1,2-phenylacetyl-CoA epoxidase subunit PaaE
VNVSLVYSSASIEKTVFLPALQQWQKEYPDRFQLDLLLSNAADLSKARLNRDIILAYLNGMSGHEKSNTLFYICGPESYMRLCTYTLRTEGIPADNIRKENFFVNHVKKQDSTPPDTMERTASITIRGKHFRFVVPYSLSILAAAKKEGIALPYSCEAGRCGACVARCVKGKVWHSYNEVLTDKELAQGLVLTCVGHPVGGNVVLKFT